MYFFQDYLLENVFMHVPEGFANQGEKHMVCKLLKSLHGIKKEPRLWNLKLIEAPADMEFIQSHCAYSFFTKKIDNDIIVDDLLVTVVTCLLYIE